MKNLLLPIVICLYLNVSVFGQNEFKGLWMVCDSTANCEDESLVLYMLVNESTISYVFSLSTGLDPELTKPSYYKIKDDVLFTTDTSSTGKVFTNQFQMKWHSSDQLELIDQKDDFNMYLYRKE
ncbi:MAG: hypothetical protein WDZ35_15600 [Crocinitomicaceae bacterium]